MFSNSIQGRSHQVVPDTPLTDSAQVTASAKAAAHPADGPRPTSLQIGNFIFDVGRLMSSLSPNEERALNYALSPKIHKDTYSETVEAGGAFSYSVKSSDKLGQSSPTDSPETFMISFLLDKNKDPQRIIVAELSTGNVYCDANIASTTPDAHINIGSALATPGHDLLGNSSSWNQGASETASGRINADQEPRHQSGNYHVRGSLTQAIIESNSRRSSFSEQAVTQADELHQPTLQINPPKPKMPALPSAPEELVSNLLKLGKKNDDIKDFLKDLGWSVQNSVLAELKRNLAKDGIVLPRSSTHPAQLLRAYDRAGTVSGAVNAIRANGGHTSATAVRRAVEERDRLSGNQ